MSTNYEFTDTEVTKERVSSELIKYKEANNITNNDLADIFSTTHQTISNWINKKKLPDYSNFSILSKLCGVDVSYFFNTDKEFRRKFTISISYKSQVYIYRPSIKVYLNNIYVTSLKQNNTITLDTGVTKNTVTFKHLFRSTTCTLDVLESEVNNNNASLEIGFNRTSGHIFVEHKGCSTYTSKNDSFNKILFIISIFVFITILFYLYITVK